jgi:outer membrane protein assembly factor BamB
MFDKENEPRLEGERISVLELQRTLEPDSAALDAQGFVAPQAWQNDFWPQNGGYPNHAMQHLALSDQPLKRVWTANIGKGARPGAPLVAPPIVVDGRVYTIDTASRLAAFEIASGKRLWDQNIAPAGEDKGVIAGGVAYSQGRLYVTSGYNELLAVDPQGGKIIWRKPLPSPSRAAPTILETRLFLTTLDNRLIAFNIEDGSVLWEFSGMAEGAGLVGAASPAASREIVVPAFSSGELFALRVENGTVAWSDNLSSSRRVGNLASLSSIRGLPVIDKGIVFAISYGGRLVAIDERSGERIWQREISGSETPWVAGNHVFVISAEGELIGMGRDNGIIRWVTVLPRWQNPDKRTGAIQWTGPVLAGGRLIMAASNGDVAEADPDTGKIIRVWKAEGPISISPVVAGGTLYLLSDKGTLAAYR